MPWTYGFLAEDPFLSLESGPNPCYASSAMFKIMFSWSHFLSNPFYPDIHAPIMGLVFFSHFLTSLRVPSPETSGHSDPWSRLRWSDKPQSKPSSQSHDSLMQGRPTILQSAEIVRRPGYNGILQGRATLQLPCNPLDDWSTNSTSQPQLPVYHQNLIPCFYIISSKWLLNTG